jgi:hypothetical protein
MAKKPKARKKTISSLKPVLTKSLKAAKALRGKVAETKELNALINSLETLRASAASNCPQQTWARKFTLVAKPTGKSAKKR